MLQKKQSEDSEGWREGRPVGARAAGNGTAFASLSWVFASYPRLAAKKPESQKHQLLSFSRSVVSDSL